MTTRQFLTAIFLSFAFTPYVHGAQEVLNTSPGAADSLPQGGAKINANFAELYSHNGVAVNGDGTCTYSSANTLTNVNFDCAAAVSENPEIFISSTPLTGPVPPGATFGIDSITGALYYVGSGAWVELPTGPTLNDTGDLPEGINLYYTEARVSANLDVTANTAARHDGTAQDALIAANVAGLAAEILSTDNEQAGQDDAIALNTAKVGHTEALVLATDVGLSPGDTIADNTSLLTALHELESAVEEAPPALFQGVVGGGNHDFTLFPPPTTGNVYIDSGPSDIPAGTQVLAENPGSFTLFDGPTPVTYAYEAGDLLTVEADAPNWGSTKLNVNASSGGVEVSDQAATGYFDFGTMRMQWGVVNQNDSADGGTVTLPAPFANAAYVVHLTQSEGTTGIAGLAADVGINQWTENLTATSFGHNRDDDIDSAHIHWFAIGLKP